MVLLRDSLCQACPMSLLLAQSRVLWPTGSSAWEGVHFTQGGTRFGFRTAKGFTQPWSICTSQRWQREKHPLMNCNYLNMHCSLLFCVCMHICVHTCVCACTHTHFVWPWTQSYCLIFQDIFSSKNRHACTHAHAGAAFYLRSQSKPGGPVFCSGNPVLGVPTVYLSRRSSGYRVQTLQLFNIKHRARQEF